MSKYVKTNSILDKILDQKQEEIVALKMTEGLSAVRYYAGCAPSPLDFLPALRQETITLIAEVKKASPSKGVLIDDFDHLKLARIYEKNGASAISVLTDAVFFQGHIDFLREINENCSIPTLRKDFIIDEIQVYEARRARASAVLLIVAALSDSQLKDLHDLIIRQQMTPLVEVHNEAEMERALKIGAKLIGINNRDLKSFYTDLAVTERLAKMADNDVTLVAESGMKSVADVVHMGAAGVHAVLIGEGLVTSPNIGEAVRLFSSQMRG
jgi:indole-3-glycerol phosphate synthase